MSAGTSPCNVTARQRTTSALKSAACYIKCIHLARWGIYEQNLLQQCTADCYVMRLHRLLAICRQGQARCMVLVSNETHVHFYQSTHTHTQLHNAQFYWSEDAQQPITLLMWSAQDAILGVTSHGDPVPTEWVLIQKPEKKGSSACPLHEPIHLSSRSCCSPKGYPLPREPIACPQTASAHPGGNPFQTSWSAQRSVHCLQHCPPLFAAGPPC
mmetsp:Transcript_5923/g.15749  ORF Transcript_5923/g.15749 Transcript_5923/m.15749 type:complete len:213 (+) Transcript_5923:289-927(+)